MHTETHTNLDRQNNISPVWYVVFITSACLINYTCSMIVLAAAIITPYKFVESQEVLFGCVTLSVLFENKRIIIFVDGQLEQFS